MVNFIQSSWSLTPANNAGVPATRLHWTYWALNANDSYGILGGNWIDLSGPGQGVHVPVCNPASFPVVGCGRTGRAAETNPVSGMA